MPTADRVRAFVHAVVNGDHAQAIADFYHPDASMQENLQSPRVGRKYLIAHEHASLEKIRSMHTHNPQALLIDGDLVAIDWTFDATGKDGVVRRLKEIAMQTWSGDRITKERFIYDTATAWRPLSPSAN